MSNFHNGHDHTPPPDQDDPLTYYQIKEIAVRELLIAKGVFSADDVRREGEKMDQRTPAKGAAVVARAWTDPSYKERLITDGTLACEEMGIDMGQSYHLVVVENTKTVHNVIVCTLCSCYPRNLIGLPPDWYKSYAYRSRAVREPRAVLAEFGLELNKSMAVHVHDSTADMRYMVLPLQPEGTESLSRNELAALVTRDCMIGIAIPRIKSTVP